MRDVISKATRRNDMGCQVMDRKTVGGSGKTTRRIVCMQINNERGSRAGDIGQGRFIDNSCSSSCICTETEQTGSECGIDQPRDPSTLERMLFKKRIEDTKAQAARIIRRTVI